MDIKLSCVCIRYKDTHHTLSSFVFSLWFIMEFLRLFVIEIQLFRSFHVSVGIKLCKKHKKANGASDNEPPLIGAFGPSCKVNGDYEEIQCHGSTGFCWCVDKFGNELEGTRTRGELNCSHPGKKGWENVTYNAFIRTS